MNSADEARQRLRGGAQERKNHLKDVGRSLRRRRFGVLDYTSQAALAEAAGVSTRTAQAVEQGQPVSANSYRLLSRALRYDDNGIEDLLAGREPVDLLAAEGTESVAREFSAAENHDGIREDLNAVMRHIAALQSEVLEIAERYNRAE